jgi:Ferritin-like
MTEPRIKTLDELKNYLYLAMQIEHATIPPYLLALYSIHPMTNSDATHILRVVVVEEMLHLTLAANILNAVGGEPDLTVPCFVPDYPAYLPTGETDFQVSLEAFSLAAVDTFLNIERPAKAPSEEKRVLTRQRSALRNVVAGKARGTVLGYVPRRRDTVRGYVPREGDTVFGYVPSEDEPHFWSIGEFYEEIKRGLIYLDDDLGHNNLFTGDRNRQATSEYYYSGGGELFPVTDLDSALAAADLIIEQGEGLLEGKRGEIYDKAKHERELSHLYRFDQLKKGKYYKPGDDPYKPSGPDLNVDWGAVYPIKKNAKLDEYPESSELYAAAFAFNKLYADFLLFLTTAYTGRPGLLIEAVPQMFTIRNKMLQLIHNPIPGMDGVNAAPTFELYPPSQCPPAGVTP